MPEGPVYDPNTRRAPLRPITPAAGTYGSDVAGGGGGAGFEYDEATLRELLRLLVNAGGAIEHVRCASRDEGTCEWSAEWKS